MVVAGARVNYSDLVRLKDAARQVRRLFKLGASIDELAKQLSVPRDFVERSIREGLRPGGAS